MDTESIAAPEAARALGVSLPTMHRALDAVGVPPASRGHTRTVPRDVVESLTALRGSTPASARTSTDLKVLALLSRSPLGRPSARSVARRAGLSPTTASRALSRLSAEGLVRQQSVTVAAGGARRENRWFAQASGWPEQVLKDVRKTHLPEPALLPSSPLPRTLHHWFWNVDATKLDPAVNGSFMAGRLLSSPDIDAWLWTVTNIAPADIDRALSRRNIDNRAAAWVRNWRGGR